MRKKWILRSIVGLCVLVIVALLVVAFSLGAIIKKGVEKVGPSATQVEVKLKSAEVWLVPSRVQLTGFVLGNPTGCRTPDAVTVGNINVRFEAKTLFSDKIVVDSINVKAPVITMEGGLTGNNLQKIEKNLNDYIGTGSTAPNSKAPPASPAKPEKKLQVNDLVITGAKVQVNSVLSANQTVTLPIPDIHLTNLGDGPQGITPVELGQRALHAVLAAATQEVAKSAGQLGKDVVNEGKVGAKKATDTLKGLFHQN